jgi:hypothetical protein
MREEQDVSFVLELNQIDLVNLEDMKSLVDMLHIDCGRFN